MFRCTPERAAAIHELFKVVTMVPTTEESRKGWHKHMFDSKGRPFKIVGYGPFWVNTHDDDFHPLDGSTDVDTREVYDREKFKNGTKAAAAVRHQTHLAAKAKAEADLKVAAAKAAKELAKKIQPK